jgi:phage terminase small subunit
MTLRQKKFLKYYFRVLNGAEAARLAGYSKRSAKELAYKLNQKPHIRREIEK